MAPLAIIFNTVNTILAQGAALGDVTMLAGFDTDITAEIPNGAMVEVDPDAGTIRLLDTTVPPALTDQDGVSRVYGPKS
jgi:predicted aconitase with swiveling domain